MTDVGGQLREIVRRALERCEAGALVRTVLEREAIALEQFGSVLALGKAAAAMVRVVSEARPSLPCLAAIPEGYPASLPEGARVVWGSHPQMTHASFRAGEEVLGMAIAASKPVLVLVSGGTSACVEVPLEPFFSMAQLIDINSSLLRSGLPIASVNSVRSHLSAIKGGRLGTRLPRGSVSIILSDVGKDHWRAVGSGPTTCDTTSNDDAATMLASLEDDRFENVVALLRSGRVPETPGEPTTDCILAGDNRDLIRAACFESEQSGFRSVTIDGELESDVSEVVDTLFAAATELESGMILVGGGEPGVVVTGSGIGGRCSEIAVRWALRAFEEKRTDLWGLMVSSDGVDGTAPAAGYVVPPRAITHSSISRAEIGQRLENADSFSAAELLCDVISGVPTGNNLRDLFMVARVGVDA